VKSKKLPTRYYLGVDLSLTSSGFVIADKKARHVTTKIIRTRAEDPIETRISYIYRELELLLETGINPLIPGKVVMGGIEGLAIHGAGQRGLQLSALHYYVRINLKNKFPNIKLCVIPPTSLKKFISGSGKCEKDKMILRCYQKWQFESENSDVCDAFSLTRFITENKSQIKSQWWI
jgi:Holliday junction resolvasome RuvABC endonuclease subunit